MDLPTAVPPVHKSVEVPATPQEAFALFTGRPADWWPREHRITECGEDIVDIVFEPFSGGRWYERDNTGAERDWGRVLEWAPPARLRLSWLIDGEFRPIQDDRLASRVEITFTESAPRRTTVELMHVELDRHGPAAAKIYAAIQGPSPGETLAQFARFVHAQWAGMHDNLAGELPFPWRRECPFAPPKPYEKRRGTRSIAKVEMSTGGEAWILTDYEQVRVTLADPRLSNDRQHPGFPSPIPVPPEFQTNASLLGMDPPEHTRYRKMVAAEFTAKRVREMRPRVQQIVDRQLAELALAGPPGDLFSEFAAPVTLGVIGGLLGIPPSDHAFLRSRTREMFGGGRSPAERKSAQNDLDGYFRDCVKGKYTDPGDDLISRLVEKHPEPEEFDHLVHLVRLLFNGGHDSSMSMIALGTLVLMRNPDQLRRLREEPWLAPGAVEELLRLLSITDLNTARVAKTDIDIGGVAITAGEGVLPSTAAANHDPKAFERPSELDITRTDARKHLAFGYGRHLCLGADLARLELEVVFSTLFQTLPGLELAVPFENLVYREGGILYSIEELPVRWRRSRRLP